MLYVAAYDIVDDGIRNKVAKYLENYGERVQYSCFEIHIYPKEQIEIITLRLKHWIEPGDRVFIYPITKRMKGNVIRLPDEKRALVEELLREYPKLSRRLFKAMFEEQIELKFETTFKRINNYLVIYDIEDDTVRNRLSNYLERIGVRVQLSVFEIEISPRSMAYVVEELIPYSNYGKVFIYPLDRNSLKGIIRIGKPYTNLDFSY
ncbi:CRISPR-associated endonuclease Cas2 [Thermovibrio sp.]